MQKLGTHPGKFFTEAALELFQCYAMRRGGLGGNEVGNGFGLGQVHFAVEEGAPCELARGGHFCAV